MINAQDKKRYEAVVILENAQSKLQVLLSRMVTDFLTRQAVGKQANEIIDTCLEQLKEYDLGSQFMTDAETSLKGTFYRWYETTLNQLLALGKISNNPIYLLSFKQITGITPKVSPKNKAMVIALEQVGGIEEGSIANIRDFFTTGEKGYNQALIDDYQKRVNKEIHNIASKNLVMLDKNGRRLSIRNLAELTIRFEEIEKDAQNLKAKGVKFAYATSHSNASQRCSIWQGKLYLIDVEVGSIKPGRFVKDYKPQSIGKIDGIEYYSLLDAINHGFLGYNCRHRLIAYQRGMTKPREYPPNQINQERSREQVLRSYENNIRHAKRNYLLATSKGEREFYRQLSKELQYGDPKDPNKPGYLKLCKRFNYPIAEWRTRVSLDERNELPSISYDLSDGITYGDYVNNK